jgi:hypothetical protein
MLIDQYPAGYYYTGLTAVPVLGLVITLRTFIPPRHSGP